MTALELVKELSAQVSNEEHRNIMLDNFDIWNNNACVGYVVKALESVDIPVAKKDEIIEKLEKVFDCYNVGEAQEIGRRGGYWL